MRCLIRLEFKSVLLSKQKELFPCQMECIKKFVKIYDASLERTKEDLFLIKWVCITRWGFYAIFTTQSVHFIIIFIGRFREGNNNVKRISLIMIT